MQTFDSADHLLVSCGRASPLIHGPFIKNTDLRYSSCEKKINFTSALTIDKHLVFFSYYHRKYHYNSNTIVIEFQQKFVSTKNMKKTLLFYFERSKIQSVVCQKKA